MNILLIQLRRLGDLILTTPAIAAIQTHFPQAGIVLVFSRECEALLPAIPRVKSVLAKRTCYDLQSWRKIGGTEFDCAIDFTRNNRSAWFTLLSRAGERIVSDRIWRKSWLRALVYNRFVDCAMKHMHTVDYHLALLQPLGILAARREPVLELPATAQEKAAAIIKEEIGSDQFAIFHPGSTRPEKFWEPERWARVMEFAAGELVPVLTSGGSAAERAHATAVRAQTRVAFVDLAGKVDLLTLAALIGRSRLLVTVDSAPMHLAAATKTPQVILFGPTNPFHWRPLNSRAAVLFGSSPKPSHEFHACAPKHAMNQISTRAVIDVIGSVLSAPAASAV